MFWRIISYSALGLLLSIGAISEVRADEFKPLNIRLIQTLEANEQGIEVFRIETLIPNDRRLTEAPSVSVIADCEVLSERYAKHVAQSTLRTQALQCKESLRGKRIDIGYTQSNPGLSTIISAEFVNGEASSIALAAHQQSWSIPEQTDTAGVIKQYFGLGFKHLLTGYDHLLFVACLIFICLGRIKSLFWAITSFTLAHSVSLAMTAFDLISLNMRAVEAIIALSIVFLAREVIVHFGLNQNEVKGKKATLSYRYPASVAGAFGLLHGLGFANILNEFGLPYNDKLAALLSFNIGIEVGQLVFIAALLIPAYAVAHFLSSDKSSNYARVSAVCISILSGVIAMFWTVERVAGVF